MRTYWSENMVLWPKVIAKHGVRQNACIECIPVEVLISVNVFIPRAKRCIPGTRIHLSALDMVAKRGFTGGRCSQS